MKVCILTDNHPRSKRIGTALMDGCGRMGWRAEVSLFVDDSKSYDLVTGYGWCHREMFETHKPYIYIDLGYWNRKLYRSDYNGFHKCVFNGRHPTKYFRRGRDSQRVTVDAPPLQPWKQIRKGKHIVLAGMSGKGALSLGLQPMEWERRTVERIRKITKRPIVYRPKPSWKAFTPIDNTSISLEPAQSINDVLVNAHALVTYYSNAAIDAMAAGVPIYTVEGAARTISIRSLEEIDVPDDYMKFDRQQFLNDIGYCHFTKDEIALGVMFRQFVEDGLI